MEIYSVNTQSKLSDYSEKLGYFSNWAAANTCRLLHRFECEEELVIRKHPVEETITIPSSVLFVFQSYEIDGKRSWSVEDVCTAPQTLIFPKRIGRLQENEALLFRDDVDDPTSFTMCLPLFKTFVLEETTTKELLLKVAENVFDNLYKKFLKLKDAQSFVKVAVTDISELQKIWVGAV